GGERRGERRELTGDELRRLLDAARGSRRTFRGLDGDARFHLYACGCGTGFRASALAGLRPEDFDLDGGTAAVTLPARLAKNRRGKGQPPPPRAARPLRGDPAGGPARPGGWGGGRGAGKKGPAELRVDP